MENMRKMRRSQYQMSPEDTERALREENWGVLSVYGEGGFPYGVPMNYAWAEGTILLHCTAGESHRLDALRRNSRVCFTVVPEHTIDRENWTTAYTSILVFGEAEILSRPEDVLPAMWAFMGRLSPERQEDALRACNPTTAKMVMIRIRPVLVTGRQNRRKNA